MDETQVGKIPSSVHEVPSRSDAFEAALERFNETMTGVREQAKHAAHYADEAVQKNPWTSVGVGFGVGVVIGVAYTLRAVQKAFYPDKSDLAHVELTEHPLPPVTPAEKLGAFALLACTLAVGLYPRLLLDLIEPAFNSALFEGLKKGVGQ